MHSKSSRTRLKITLPMVKTLLSHHEVVPVFLEFMFSFRKQKFKKHFDFNGFRAHESWASQPIDSITTSPALRLQLCYNLRCIEVAEQPEHWPWSMRQTAIYHSFDLTCGDSVWINVKNNSGLSPRIKSLIKKSAPSDPTSMLDVPGAFRAALATHLVYCEWASERWAGYVGFLEDELQHKTRYALLAGVSRPKESPRRFDAIERRQTAPPLRRQTTMASIASASRDRLARVWRTPRLAQHANAPATITENVEMMIKEPILGHAGEGEDFTYDDLRAIQYIEDQANMAVLAIRSNISIINELLSYHQFLRKSEEYQKTLGITCDLALRRFYARIASILSDLKLHQSRVETLLHFLADRKALVSTIGTSLQRSLANYGSQLLQLFAHRNMSANKEMTDKAHESAQKMEALTAHMKHIALKTERETIFMRIITVVTLFFLPGTFVAVSLLRYHCLVIKELIPQTLMSTDIVKFNDRDALSRFSWQACLMYFGITIPIMAFTLWFAFRYRNREHERLQAKRVNAIKADLELGLAIDD